MGDALAGLYEPDLITLSDNRDTPGFKFDRKVMDVAAKWLHEKGSFSPEMLEEEPAKELMEETYRILSTAVSSSIRQDVPPELRYALENNTFIFSGFKTYHTLNEAGLHLVDEKGQIKPFESFVKDVQVVHEKYNRNYLYAEYNHAMHASQMAVKWNDFGQDGDRYDLQYRTAGDDKVRADHAALNGTTLPKSDPFWTMYMPPNGWNCRCNVVQVRKGKYQESDSKQAIEAGNMATDKPKLKIFRFNPGASLKIFPDKHPYYKTGKKEKEIIKQVTEKDIREKRIEVLRAQLPDNLTDFEKDAKAANNYELEKALGITIGKPMSVEEADKQHANPNYGKNRAYSINCQTCTPAYVLRTMGLNVSAKPNTPGSKLEYLSKGYNTWEVWKNADGTAAKHTGVNDWLDSKKYKKMTEKRWLEFFNETCKDTGIYGLSIGWTRGGGHMTVLQRFPNGELRYIEPQCDNSEGSGHESFNLNHLARNGASTQHGCRGIMRIDNKLFNLDFIEIFDK